MVNTIPPGPMANSNNVVLFPRERLSGPPQSMEEIIENVRTVRISNVETAMSELMPFLIEAIENLGFDFDDGQGYSKDVALVCEALRALLLKASGVEYSVQRIAEQMFQIDGGGFSIADELNVDLSD